MKGLFASLGSGTRYLIRGLDALGAVFDLVLRGYLAKIFWTSGMVKLSSWTSTVALFGNLYSVPLLSPEVAAALGIAVEIGGSALLLLGLGGRFAAAALFALNTVSVIAYPQISDLGLKDHFYWGILLLILTLHGPGKLSIDYLIRRRYGP